MQVFDIRHVIENQNSVYYVFGRTEDQEIQKLKVYGFIFRMFFTYFEYDSGGGGGTIETIKIELEEKLKNVSNLKYLYVTEKQNFFGFSEQKIKVFCVGLTSYAGIKPTEEYFNSIYTESNIEIFEKSFDPIISFISNLKLQCWLNIKKVKYITKDFLYNVCDIMDIESVPLSQKSNIAPLVVLSFDIECVSDDGSFPHHDRDPVIQIGCVVVSAVSSTSQAEETLYEKTIFMVNTCTPLANTNVHSFQTEEQMLIAWSDFVISIDPDIITGYNIQTFDIPYILGRMSRLGIAQSMKFGRDKHTVTAFECKINRNNNHPQSFRIYIFGRVVIDIYLYIAQNYNLNSYTLDSVSEHFIGDHKKDVHYSQIQKLHAGTEDDRKRLAEYCVKDAELPLLLAKKVRCFINIISLAGVCYVPMEYIIARGQQIRIRSLISVNLQNTDYILPEFKNNNVCALNDEDDDEVNDDDSYAGGAVLSPELGFHNRPIVTLDYASLYPSIMIAHNLCYSTLIRDNHDHSTMLFVDGNPDAYTSCDISTNETYRFVKRAFRQGVLPGILINLLVERQKIRKLMEAIDKNSNEYAVYNGLQLAFKVCANAIYGFTGAQKCGSMPCVAISSTVTAFGRQMLFATKKFILHEYTEAKIIYGDTDSVMIDFNEPSLQSAMRVGREAADKISKLFIDPIKLQFEKVYFPFLITAKKRYAGLCWTNLEQYDKIDCKGIETVRRDNCSMVSRVMNQILNLLFIKRDFAEIEQTLRNEILKIKNSTCDLRELIITKSYSKKNYSVVLPHVMLVQRMRKQDSQSAPKVGDRIPYLIVETYNPKDNLSKRARSPIEVSEKQLAIDVNYYVYTQLLRPVNRLLEHIKEINVKDIFNLNKNGKPNCPLKSARPTTTTNSSRNTITNYFQIKRQKIDGNYVNEEKECRKYFDICKFCQGENFKKVKCLDFHCKHFFPRSSALQQLRNSFSPEELVRELSF